VKKAEKKKKGEKPVERSRKLKNWVYQGKGGNEGRPKKLRSAVKGGKTEKNFSILKQQKGKRASPQPFASGKGITGGVLV